MLKVQNQPEIWTIVKDESNYRYKPPCEFLCDFNFLFSLSLCLFFLRENLLYWGNRLWENM